MDTGFTRNGWPRDGDQLHAEKPQGRCNSRRIARYIVNPGQACAYKVGMLKLQELRARAQSELGAKFDQREFHDVVLKNGAVPLEVLEEQVNAYIRRTKG